VDSTTAHQNFWRKCSSCKQPIGLGAIYYVCSVSTCNGLRTGYVFCSVPCFERHLPAARHKDAGAVEKKAPLRPDSADPTSSSASGSAPARVFASTSPAGVRPASSASPSAPREVLVIASRLKDYIHARSEYNTSSSVMDVLSDHLRVICQHAIDNARAEGRKTVMDRDFEFLKKS
jgi:hypothetical protein